MEENHQDLTLSFNFSDAGNEEIRVAIGSVVEENIRKLYQASKMGSIQTFKTLIQEDPNLIHKILTSTSNTESPLHVSISNGHLEFTRLLLQHKPELATEVDAFQRTPLHLASMHGDKETIQALLEKNTSACLVYNKNGLIPLHYAIIGAQIEIMQELINARPQSVWMKLNSGQTILHLCVESNHLEGIKLLIERFMNHDEDFLNIADDKGNTILDLSIMLRQSEMVGYLLSIPEVKTRTSIIASDFATANATKESPESQKMTGRWKELRKNLKYKGDWVQEVQGTMMLVATVIATVTFQAGVNPPGGVWQQDTLVNCSSNTINQYYGIDFYNSFCDETPVVFAAGTAIMSYQQPTSYWFYSRVNAISFLASMSVILLVVSRFPLKNKICSLMLALAMCVAVVFLAIGYVMGFKMVNVVAIPIYNGSFLIAICWFGIIGIVGLYHVIHFLVRVVKNLLRTFTSNG